MLHPKQEMLPVQEYMTHEQEKFLKVTLYGTIIILGHIGIDIL